jgi:lipoprotein-anchoring transpeptidase ErfK/SrfK
MGVALAQTAAPPAGPSPPAAAGVAKPAASPPAAKPGSPPAAPAAPGAVPGAAAPGAAAPGQAAVDPLAAKKPRKFWIDGKFRELKKGEIRPYTAPTLLPEPEPVASDIKVLEVAKLEEGEAQVLARPYYGAPMIGTVVPGTRIAVRGETISKSSHYCHSKRWLAMQPFGWLCADFGKPTTEPPTADPVLKIVPGERVPYKYVMVGSTEPLPMWTNLDALKDGAEPERQLQKNDSIAVEKTVRHEGQTYYQSAEGKILPVKGTYSMEHTSQWHGIIIDEKMHLPFGWILPDTVKLQASPEQPAAVGTLPRRTRVDILAEQTIKGKRYLQIRLAPPPTSPFPLATEPLPEPVTPPAPAAPPPAKKGTAKAAPLPPPLPAADATFWVPSWAVNEVRRIPRPPGTGDNPQWFDADLGEQVLVLYQNDRPIYATLISSGRNNATPLGNYPVWARVAAITMKSQPYDDKPYFVNMVPWSTFFQAHNAIHGAYWHDRFGAVKSHGCINVAPLDARYVFESLQPGLPPGWTSVRPPEVTKWPTLHVHNSSQKVDFKQERPIGPTDRLDEAERLEDAERRRAEQLQLQAQAGPPTAPSTGSAIVPPRPAPPLPTRRWMPPASATRSASATMSKAATGKPARPSRRPTTSRSAAICCSTPAGPTIAVSTTYARSRPTKRI